jgi:hypothetical protein
MGTKKVCPNAVAAYTDVRDVARAHLLVYERPHDAPSSRYVCIGAVLHRSRLVQLLGDLFPDYHVTAKYVIMFNAHIWILFICPFERCLTNVSCMYGVAGAKTTASQWPGRTGSPTRGSGTWDWSSLLLGRVCTRR